MTGRRVGPYELHGRIAEGGMATVWLGTRTHDDGAVRPVAVKEMQPALARDPAARQMFLDEARLASRIRHPRVVAVLEVLVEDDGLYLVLEYVHGPTLAAIARTLAAHGRAIPLAIGAALVVDLLLGLDAAHEAVDADGRALGIVHRDVSPDNVLVAADGHARITDFGVASGRDRGHRTATGEVKGKAAYMAPEQARAEKVDRRADVHAAGAVAYEVFAQARAFGQGTTPELVARVLFEPAPLLGMARPDAPAALEAAIAVALSKDPAARFATAKELAEAIAAAVPPAEPERVGAWLREELGDFFAARDPELARALGGGVPRRRAAGGGRRPWVGSALVVGVLVAGSGIAVRAFAPRVTVSAPALASASADGPAVTASSAPAASPASEPSQARTTAAPAAAAPSSPERGASAPRRPSAPGRTGTSASAPAPARAGASTASSGSSARRPCCLRIGEAFERYAFTECEDNCPPGTP